MSDDLIHAGVTTLDLATLSVIVGIAATRLWILPYNHDFSVSPQRLPALALFLLAFTAIGDLALRTAALADVPLAEAWPFIPKALTSSDYGKLWMLRALVWAGLVMMAVMIRRRGWTDVALRGVAIGGAAIALFISSTGHAGDAGIFTLSNVMGWLHIVSGCVWGGTVVVYAVTILPRLRRGSSRGMVAQSAVQLSTVAGVALGGVLLSGFYHVWHQLDTLSSLWTTDYGRVLLVKLAAVMVMMGIGIANRFLIVPGVEKWALIYSSYAENGAARSVDPAQRFLQILRIDAVVFILILVLAAVLGMQTPPSHNLM
jgi:putative copper resistance protein D